MWGIFSTIAGWVANIAKGLKFWMHALFELLIEMCSTWWGVVLIFASVTFIAFKDMGLMLGSILTLVGTINAPNGESMAPPGGFASWLAVTNTFCPVDETFSYLVVYVQLALLFGLYRLIKSWIPGGFAGGS